MIQKEWRALSVKHQKVRVDDYLQRMISLEVTDWIVADGARIEEC